MHTSKSKDKEELKKLQGIYERIPGSGTWWIRFADRPYHIRREKAGTRSAAKELYKHRTSDVLKGQKLPPTRRGRTLLVEIAEDFLGYSKREKRSWRTDESRIPVLVKKFGSRISEEIAPAEFTTWVGEHKEWKKATQNRYLSLIKRIYSYAEDETKKIGLNPVRHMKVSLRDENNVRERFLNQYDPLPTTKAYLKPHTTEEARLVAVIRRKYSHHLPEFEIALYTGLRPSEQFGLTWDRVDLNRRTVHIPKSKHGKARNVPLNDTALAGFERLHHRNGKQNYVFLSERQDQSPFLHGARHWFHHAVTEAGLRNVPDNQGVPHRFRWYDLRHSYGTRLIERGVPINMVRDLMGHLHLVTTQRYLHTKNEDALAAVLRLDEPKAEAQRLRLIKKKAQTA